MLGQTKFRERISFFLGCELISREKFVFLAPLPAFIVDLARLLSGVDYNLLYVRKFIPQAIDIWASNGRFSMKEVGNRAQNKGVSH